MLGRQRLHPGDFKVDTRGAGAGRAAHRLSCSALHWHGHKLPGQNAAVGPLPPQVVSQVGDVCRIAVPMALYFAIMWFFCFFFFYKMG